MANKNMIILSIIQDKKMVNTSFISDYGTCQNDLNITLVYLGTLIN